jgi:hypothetical protein
MGSYGGVRPYPRRYGGAKPKAKVFLDAMTAARGTAYDAATPTTAVYIENLAIARAIARAWDTNEGLGNIWNARRMGVEMLERWERIYALAVDPDDTLDLRRGRLEVLQLAIGQASIASQIATLLTNALGSVFVAVETIGVGVANIGVPDGSFPFGVVISGCPWFSTVNHLLIRVTQPTGYRDDQFYDAVARIFEIVDPMLPSHMTFDWYRAPQSGTPVVVAGGPSAAGFYLDERNLDESVFDV